MKASELIACVSTSDHEFMATVVSVAVQMENEEAAWIADLRAQGVKAAHPDDGWVDRKENPVFFCYPQFNDGVSVGDKIALGWPSWSLKNKTRIVRCTSISSGLLSGRDSFFFEEIKEPEA